MMPFMAVNEQINRLQAENASLRAELDRLHNFSPTGEQAAIVCLQENAEAFLRLNQELEEELARLRAR